MYPCYVSSRWYTSGFFVVTIDSKTCFPIRHQGLCPSIKKNRYKITVARRWHLDFRRLLLRIVASHVLFKEPDMKTTGPHAINRASDLWRICSWEVVDHPLYSPDFLTSDFHLFEPLKKHLAGKKFATDDDVEQTDTSSLEASYTDFLYGEIQNLGATLQYVFECQWWIHGGLVCMQVRLLPRISKVDTSSPLTSVIF